VSKTGEGRIRQATVADVETILHHRRRMFADMGDGREAELEVMVTSARPFLMTALQDGSYRAWLIEVGDRVVAGGGVAIVPINPRLWIPHPAGPTYSTCTQSRSFADRAWRSACLTVSCHGVASRGSGQSCFTQATRVDLCIESSDSSRPTRCDCC
jgi:hypothetical protein